MPVPVLPVSEGVFDGTRPEDKSLVDVLFYGAWNTRRRRIMKRLTELLALRGYTVKCLHNVYGDTLYEWIRRSRIVIHLNYYSNALLATYRLNEALSHQRVVVAERPSANTDQENVNLYADSGVCFVDPLDDTADDVQQKLFYPVYNRLRQPKLYRECVRLGQDFATQHVATYRARMVTVLQEARVAMDNAQEADAAQEVEAPSCPDSPTHPPTHPPTNTTTPHTQSPPSTPTSPASSNTPAPPQHT